MAVTPPLSLPFMLWCYSSSLLFLFFIPSIVPQCIVSNKDWLHVCYLEFYSGCYKRPHQKQLLSTRLRILFQRLFQCVKKRWTSQWFIIVYSGLSGAACKHWFRFIQSVLSLFCVYVLSMYVCAKAKATVKNEKQNWQLIHHTIHRQHPCYMLTYMHKHVHMYKIIHSFLLLCSNCAKCCA